VKKRQQRVVMILESKGISYEAVDITEPGKEEDKEFMQKNSKLRDENDRHPLPPQIFNDGEYCGVSIIYFFAFPSLPHPLCYFCHAEQSALPLWGSLSHIVVAIVLHSCMLCLRAMIH